MLNETDLFDLFPYVYKSMDANIRRIDATGWDEVFEPTYTSIEHSRRLIIEWGIDTIAILLSLILCTFLWSHKNLMVTYAHSITFVTFAAQVLYWPFYLLSTWQTIFLLFGRKPMYPSILHCTILRHFVLACFQSAGLVTFPVAINRLYFVIFKKSFCFGKMVFIQIGITFAQLGFTLGHLAVGKVTFSDICAKWIASPEVFKVSLYINSFALVVTILVHIFVIFIFPFRMEQDSQEPSQTGLLKFNTCSMLLIQSWAQYVLALPLSTRQFQVLTSGRRPTNFATSYGYMFTFVSVFLVPLISMICVPAFRKAMWSSIRCQDTKVSNNSNEPSNDFEICSIP